MQIFRMRGIGDVDNRGAVRLGLPGQRIDRIGNRIGAAVMADIGDPAVALTMDGRLIGAARLQIVAADQPHVQGFRGRADDLLLRMRAIQAGDQDRGDRCDRNAPAIHALLAPCSRPVCAGCRDDIKAVDGENTRS